MAIQQCETCMDILAESTLSLTQGRSRVGFHASFHASSPYTVHTIETTTNAHALRTDAKMIRNKRQPSQSLSLQPVV